MCFRKFAVQKERYISVEPLLQVIQLIIGTVPLGRLVHHQHGFIRFRVMGDHINYRGVIVLWVVAHVMAKLWPVDVPLSRWNLQPKMPRLFWLAFFVLLTMPRAVNSQFVPGLLQNRSYWGGGKSEIDFYQAEFRRDGEPRQCEVLVILTPVFFDPNTMSYVDDSKSPGTLPAIRMNEYATIPRGVAVEQRSIEALWRMDSMSLARLSFNASDPIGNFVKTVRENRQADRVTWTYSSDSYAGRTEPQPLASPTKPMIFYDELPLSLRTLDFSKTTGEFEIGIAPTLASPQKDLGEIKPAKLSWKLGERSIDVEVQHAAGKDRFVLDANFPFLLREWTASDGMHWKMKNSIRADYRKYLRNGDRERALKDPMLRHPD